jgi:hypothetical protein
MAGNRFEEGKNTAKQVKTFIFARLVGTRLSACSLLLKKIKKVHATGVYLQKNKYGSIR